MYTDLLMTKKVCRIRKQLFRKSVKNKLKVFFPLISALTMLEKSTLWAPLGTWLEICQFVL